jgi:predicted nucleic acid-binding protein
MNEMNASIICVDASIVIPLVVEGGNIKRISELWITWHESESVLIAPTLLSYEVTNVLRRYLVHGELSEEETTKALQAALAFDLTLYNDDELHLKALYFANRFSLPAAYDACSLFGCGKTL